MIWAGSSSCLPIGSLAGWVGGSAWILPTTGPGSEPFSFRLRGRDIAIEEFFQITEDVAAATASGSNPAPRLLYTESELKDMRKMQAMAHAEATENTSGKEVAS